MSLTYINLYHSYLDAFEMLSDAEVGRLVRGALIYSTQHIEPDFKGNERFVWGLIRGQINRDQEAYDKRCRKNKENVLQRYTNEYDGIRSYTNATKEKEKEKEKDISPPNISPPRGKFVPPTVEDVRLYCQERKNQVNPDQFVDFYASKGWKVGNQSMKDWKAAVRTWEKRDVSEPKGPSLVDIAIRKRKGGTSHE